MRIHRSKPHRSSSAFTLIELLVVIAILGLLIAMLLPVLTSAKETSRRVLCSANMRQWGITINAYAADCGGWYPGVTAWGANDIFSDFDLAWGYPTPVLMEEAYKKWMEQYGFALKITRCPSRTQPRWSWSDNYPSAWFATDYFHFFGRADRDMSDNYYYYGWTNSYWNWTSNNQCRAPVPNVDKFRRSNRTVLAYDRSWTVQNPGYYYDQGNFDEESNHANRRGEGNGYLWAGNLYVLKYAEGANYLLLDGSATWSNLSDPQNVYYLGNPSGSLGHDYYRYFVVGKNLRYP